MVPEVLNRVCYGQARPEPSTMRPRSITPAILPNHCRHRVQRCDFPAVIVSEGHTVRGTWVTGLSAMDVWRLDNFEGSMYERVTVKVKLLAKVDDATGKSHEKGEEVETQTYVWIAENDELEEREWDFEEFRREKLQRWTGLSDEYTEVDEAVAAGSHDPTGGRGVDGSIAKQLDAGELDEVVRSAI
ncbi:MAG: hypothetical protein M1816_000587 [Peltula sp. TS41687]|nr:MAG: hypothetical protein M1816_000587 [Peltula sp. TS41687]